MHGFEELANALQAMVTNVHAGGITARILGTIFVWSATNKLARPTATAVAIMNFGVVRHVRTTLGVSLGLGELALGSILLVGLVPELALASASLTLAAFTVLIVRALRQGRSFSCSCFGSHGRSITIPTAIRTLLFLALALIGLVNAVSRQDGWPLIFSSAGGLQMVVALAATATTALAAVGPGLASWNSELIELIESFDARGVAG